MDFRDLVTLYFERTNAMQTLWSIYITIVLGLLGFVGTAKPRTAIVVAMAIAFCGFAYVNCDALRSVTWQRNVVASLVRAESGKGDNSDARLRIAGTLDPPSVRGVIAFHVLGDVLVLSAILFLGLKRTLVP